MAPCRPASHPPPAPADAGDLYPALDRFGRVVDQRWIDGTGTALDRYTYVYDANSNITEKDNLAARAALSTTLSPFDEAYTRRERADLRRDRRS